jgi:dihydroxy-acid dehydratase
VLPRGIAIGFKAFENAMTLDIAMGGSTNTILHLLAIAQEAVSTSPWPTSTACRARAAAVQGAPNTNKYHIEDVHRAGGIMAILGELDRAGKLHTDVPTVHAPTMKAALDQWDIVRNPATRCGPSTRPARPASPPRSPSARPPAGPAWTPTAPKAASARHTCLLQEGGLAVLYGNIALTAAWSRPPAWTNPSWCSKAIGPGVPNRRTKRWPASSADKVKAGDVVIVRYEGPKGGPGMQEMLYPTSYIKSKGLGKACALLTDGRFSGGTSGLSIGHCSPEAAAGGAIGLVRNGDRIRIDIPNRSINVLVSDEELARRRAEQDARRLEAGPAAPAQGQRRAEGLRTAGHLGRQGRGAGSVKAGRLST